MNDKITIIVPVYKVETTLLEKCLLSLKKQTYRNIEVLIILDGADDEIISYCMDFSNRDSRFQVISRENKGVSYSRNEGIKKASGTWISFVDADDWVEENMCELFINTILKLEKNVDFVMFTNYVNDSNKQIQIKNKLIGSFYVDDDIKFKLFQSTYGASDGGFRYCESVWNNFYKKDFLDTNQILFHHDIKVGEDMLFNYQVWLNSDVGYYNDIPVYHYRVNENSVMHSDYEKLLLKYEQLFIQFDQFMNDFMNETYKKNNELFVIRQIERFAIKYYFKNQLNFKGFKYFVNQKYYKEKIKKAKLSSLTIKHRIFCLLLKVRCYFILGVLCYFLYKKRGE